jgi:hypothetical protein
MFIVRINQVINVVPLCIFFSASHDQMYNLNSKDQNLKVVLKFTTWICDKWHPIDPNIESFYNYHLCDLVCCSWMKAMHEN